MANKLKADGTVKGEGPPLNSELRSARLTAALSKTYEIDCKLKRLAAQHLQALRDEKSKIKKGLRDDLQMTAKVFNSRYIGYRLECEARDAEDTATLDNIREMHAAAPVNTTINMIAALDEDEDADSAEGYTDQDIEDLRENGRQAARMFRDQSTNPHKDDPALGKVWLDGFQEQTAKMSGEALDGGGGPDQPAAP